MGVLRSAFALTSAGSKSGSNSRPHNGHSGVSWGHWCSAASMPAKRFSISFVPNLRPLFEVPIDSCISIVEKNWW